MSLFCQINTIQHTMKLYVVQKCQCLSFSVVIVASIAGNDRLVATWPRYTVPLVDFCDPNVLDSLFQVLRVGGSLPATVSFSVVQCSPWNLDLAIPRPFQHGDIVLFWDISGYLGLMTRSAILHENDTYAVSVSPSATPRSSTVSR